MRPTLIIDGEKECSDCATLKPLYEFNKCRKSANGRQSKCKICKAEHRRQYQRSDKYKKHVSKYVGNRRKTDPIYNLKHKISRLLRDALTGRYYYKDSSRWSGIVGLTSSKLVDHLISTFTSRYGTYPLDLKTIEIDHIVPISQAKNESEVEMLNHYTNLQLLTKDDNRTKNVRLEIKEDSHVPQ